ncbi:MAG TPA: ABC transporter ATP-binding protein [Chthonomonadaceae bacterium]|nr:ABC transporter ATP-binding protein [Chthonomonadaceae bacterium]
MGTETTAGPMGLRNKERGVTVVVSNLRVDYRLRQETLTVVDIPAWSVAAGEQVAIHGPSGSGKSTLLHVLSGVIAATQGSVTVCGTDLAPLREAERDRFRARHIGYVFQNLNLLAGYTALENVLMGATFTGGKMHNEEARALLRTVGLAERMHHTPGEMSFGEQQRVAIARALVKRPELVLADEPTGSLDPRNTVQVLHLLRSACEAQGSALILVTHEPVVLEQFERRVSYAELNRAWREVEAAA